MPVQLNIFLLLFGGLQGLLLSLFLASKRSYRSGYIFLIIYILVMLLQITMKVVSKVWLMTNMDDVYFLSYRLPFLYGPLAYLLVVYLLGQERQFRLIDLLHFVPFILAVCVLFDYHENSFSNFLREIFFDAVNSMRLQLFSITAYHILAFRLWYLHDKTVKNTLSNLRRLQIRWLRSFIVVSFFVCVIISLAIFFMYVNFPHWNNVRFLFVALTIFIYWISYTALSQPSVFSVIKGQESEESPVPALSPRLVVHRPAKKYSNSGLNAKDILNINSVLQKVMTEEKPFLNPELTINDLAALVKCNRHHLSQALNESLQQSFNDYMNYCRVEAAKQVLLDPSKEDHKIASIAYYAGFNSLSTFNDVFKKRTGSTPSQFLKEVLHASKQQRG